MLRRILFELINALMRNEWVLAMGLHPGMFVDFLIAYTKIKCWLISADLDRNNDNNNNIYLYHKEIITTQEESEIRWLGLEPQPDYGRWIFRGNRYPPGDLNNPALTYAKNRFI